MRDIAVSIICFVLVMFVLVFERNPEYFGERLARMDIAYDRVMQEHFKE